MRAFPTSARHTSLGVVPLLLLLAAGALALTQVRGEVAIVEVHYDPFSPGEDDEYVVISNDGADGVDLSGWDITDWEDVSRLNGTLPPGGRMVLTRDADTIMAKEPGLLDRMSPCSLGPSLELRLANYGDEVVLRDRDGIRDTFVYGDGDPCTGWDGDPAPSLHEGEIAIRVGRDTNSSSDWTSGRLRRLGQSDFRPQHLTSGHITALVTPDCTDAAILELIGSAREAIHVEAYEILSPTIADGLSNASIRGVNVSVLLDGGPVGWSLWNVPETEYLERHGALDKAYMEKLLVERMVSAGVDVRFHTADDPRYVFIHSKCIVTDDAVLISSDNLVEGSFPHELGFSGTSVVGSRGWAAILRGSEVAGYFRNVIEHDLAGYDVSGWGEPPYDPPPDYFDPELSHPSRNGVSHVHPVVVSPLSVNRSIPVLPVLSPDTSSGWPVVSMIENATEFVYVELLDLNPNWSRMGSNGYLDALVDAAGRGVDVRILLDTTWGSPGGSFDNHEMAQALVDASTELPHLRCRLFSPHGLTMLHNKGAVADDRVLVSSINWGFNSVFRNREMAVIIDDREIAGYFARAFLRDWNRTALDDILVSIAFDGGYAVHLSGVNGSHTVNVMIGQDEVFASLIEEGTTHSIPLEGSSGPVIVTIDGTALHVTDVGTVSDVDAPAEGPTENSHANAVMGGMMVTAMAVWYVIFRKLRG